MDNFSNLSNDSRFSSKSIDYDVAAIEKLRKEILNVDTSSAEQKAKMDISNKSQNMLNNDILNVLNKSVCESARDLVQAFDQDNQDQVYFTLKNGSTFHDVKKKSSKYIDINQGKDIEANLLGLVPINTANEVANFIGTNSSKLGLINTLVKELIGKNCSDLSRLTTTDRIVINAVICGQRMFQILKDHDYYFKMLRNFVLDNANKQTDLIHQIDALQLQNNTRIDELLTSFRNRDLSETQANNVDARIQKAFELFTKQGGNVESSLNNNINQKIKDFFDNENKKNLTEKLTEKSQNTQKFNSLQEQINKLKALEKKIKESEERQNKALNELQSRLDKVHSDFLGAQRNPFSDVLNPDKEKLKNLERNFKELSDKLTVLQDTINKNAVKSSDLSKKVDMVDNNNKVNTSAIQSTQEDIGKKLTTQRELSNSLAKQIKEVKDDLEGYTKLDILEKEKKERNKEITNSIKNLQDIIDDKLRSFYGKEVIDSKLKELNAFKLSASEILEKVNPIIESYSSDNSNTKKEFKNIKDKIAAFEEKLTSLDTAVNLGAKSKDIENIRKEMKKLNEELVKKSLSDCFNGIDSNTLDEKDKIDILNRFIESRLKKVKTISKEDCEKLLSNKLDEFKENNCDNLVSNVNEAEKKIKSLQDQFKDVNKNIDDLNTNSNSNKEKITSIEIWKKQFTVNIKSLNQIATDWNEKIRQINSNSNNIIELTNKINVMNKDLSDKNVDLLNKLKAYNDDVSVISKKIVFNKVESLNKEDFEPISEESNSELLEEEKKDSAKSSKSAKIIKKRKFAKSLNASKSLNAENIEITSLKGYDKLNEKLNKCVNLDNMNKLLSEAVNIKMNDLQNYIDEMLKKVNDKENKEKINPDNNFDLNSVIEYMNSEAFAIQINAPVIKIIKTDRDVSTFINDVITSFLVQNGLLEKINTDEINRQTKSLKESQVLNINNALLNKPNNLSFSSQFGSKIYKKNIIKNNSLNKSSLSNISEKKSFNQMNVDFEENEIKFDYIDNNKEKHAFVFNDLCLNPPKEIWSILSKEEKIKCNELREKYVNMRVSQINQSLWPQYKKDQMIDQLMKIKNEYSKNNSANLYQKKLNKKTSNNYNAQKNRNRNNYKNRNRNYSKSYINNKKEKRYYNSRNRSYNNINNKNNNKKNRNYGNRNRDTYNVNNKNYRTNFPKRKQNSMRNRYRRRNLWSPNLNSNPNSSQDQSQPITVAMLNNARLLAPLFK